MHRHLLQVRASAFLALALLWSAPAAAQAWDPIMNYGGGPTGTTGGGGTSPCSTFGSTAGTCAQGNDTRITGALQSSNNLNDVSSPSAALLNLGGIGAATIDTLQNKSISGSLNTITAIANVSLVNSSMTIAGHVVALGGTQALASTDLSNSSAIMLLTAVQSPTNKTLDFSLNTATKIPLSAFTNLGTTTQVLHGNAAGSPSFSAVGLGSDVSGQLPFANIANVSANSVLGNNTGLGAAPTSLTPSQVLDIIGNTRGSVLYRGAFGWAALTPGTSGNFLKTQGAGADPVWDIAGGGTVSLTCGNGLLCNPSPITGTGSISPAVTLNAKTGNYAIASADGGSLISSTSGTAVADTIVASSNSGFGVGFGVDLFNIGTAKTTLTATTSVFDNGQNAIVLGIGQDAFVWGDGTNYHAVMSLEAIPNNTVYGNIIGHTEYPTGLTQTQLTTLINNFSSSLSGTVAASGGGTTNFLRADGTWAAPPGGGSGLTIGTTTITSGTPNGLLYDNAGVVGNLATGNNGVLITNGSGVPSVSTTLPSGLAATNLTLTTPTLGVAAATSLALNGCTIGANAICATGSANFSTSLIVGTGITLGASSALQYSGRAFISSPGNNIIQIGNANSASPSAQTLGFQNGAGTNIAGQNTVIQASVGSGNAAQGNLILQVGQPTTSGSGYGTALNGIVIVGGSALVELPNISSDATHTDTTACIDSTTKAFYSGSGTLGICLGTSSIRYKHGVENLAPGLPEIMALSPKSFYLNKDHGDPTKLLYGFIAEDMVKVLPKLVALDKQGRPNTADYLGVVPVLVKAMHQQQDQIENLKKQVANDNDRIARLEAIVLKKHK